MDKKELKSDIIREKIADGIIYIKDNGKKFFYFFVFVILALGIYIYTSNNNQTIGLKRTATDNSLIQSTYHLSPI